MATIQELTSKFAILRANPTAMCRLALNALEDTSNGTIQVVNATNPLMFLLESAASMASAGMLQDEAIVRKLYSANAITEEELYLHMSDKDYLNRFATPARINFTFLMSLDEIKARAVLLTDGSGVRKLTIPRHTEVSIGGLVFTLQHPIDIRVLVTDGLSIHYDTSVATPLYDLETNTVDWAYGSYSGIKFIRMSVPFYQMSILSQIAQLNNLTGLYKEYSYPDNFYYCRAFTKNTVDSTWEEITITHTEQVYDPAVATVALKVLSGRIGVKVPQIYFNNGLIKDSLRIDIYTTKGALDVDLSSFAAGSYSVRWNDYDAVGDSIYTAPLSVFSGLDVITETAVTGGSNGVSLANLREQVITNGLTNPSTPITKDQLITSLSAAGYKVVTNIDNVTDRQFIALRGLPPPTNKLTTSGAGVTIKLLQSSLVDLVQHSTIKNHGNRVTILPSTLFKDTDGIVSVVTDSERLSLLSYTSTAPDVLANTINSSKYYYTPFYYVLDVSNNLFDVRAYRLDTPTITERDYVEENTPLLVEASSKLQTVLLHPAGTGYRVLVEANVNDTYKAFDVDQVFLQLSFIPQGTNVRNFINGTLVSPLDTLTGKPANGRYIYSFDILTNFDVNDLNQLVLSDTRAALNLSTRFDLSYIVKNHVPVGATTSDIDDYVDATILPGYDSTNMYLGATHEQIVIKFGNRLDKLWTRGRTVLADNKYAKYTVDVPAIYTQNVYERDTTGNIKLVYNTTTSEYTANLLHTVGDPVLDTLGAPVLKHKVGDVMFDNNGDPILLGGLQGILRQVDLFLLDGRYYFATDSSTLAYKEELGNLVEDWCVNDLSYLANRLLERSEIYYYPKITSGLVEVTVNANESAKINSDQTLRVVYYVTAAVHNNDILKESIVAKTASVIDASLKSTTITVSDITSNLRSGLGSDVISVELYGLADGKYNTFTLKGDRIQPTIGKRLVVLSNQTLAVQDAIAVEFVKHLGNVV